MKIIRKVELKQAELFYLEQGGLEYETPQGKTAFTAGSGGFVNSNVLHMSRAKDGDGAVASLLHIFNPLLISGQSGSIIDRKYVSPLMTASHVEIIGLYPDQPSHVPVLEALRQSFGYQRAMKYVCGRLCLRYGAAFLPWRRPWRKAPNTTAGQVRR